MAPVAPADGDEGGDEEEQDPGEGEEEGGDGEAGEEVDHTGGMERADGYGPSSRVWRDTRSAFELRPRLVRAQEFRETHGQQLIPHGWLHDVRDVFLCNGSLRISG